MTTCGPSQPTLWPETELASMSSAAGSPARTSARRARALDWPASAAGFGQNINDLSEIQGHSSRLLKTPHAFALADWTLFSGASMRSAMMLSGTVYRRPSLAPLTRGTASGLSVPGPNSKGMWPTPTTGDHSTLFAQGGMPLGMAVRMWPTPRAEDSQQTGGHRGKPDTLTSAVRMWPTPNASDNRDRGNLSNPSIQRRIAMGKQVNLGMAAGGALNPDWVEWLMGCPIGWTDCDALVTESSRKSPSSSGGDSGE
jgi:hypothetical protein